jgi:hypothetical protein
LFKKLGGAVQGSGRPDLAGVKIQFKRQGPWKSQVDCLLQKDGKNFFRALSGGETESSGLAGRPLIVEIAFAS